MEKFIFLAALVLTFVGVSGRVMLDDICMSAEESVKDGRISYRRARWRMRLARHGSAGLTVGGVGLLILTLLVASA